MAEQKKSKDITQLAKQLQQPESKTILDEMSSMAESPEYKRNAPPETQGQLASALQQAKDMYDREATKNEWLEVAQSLAGAVAQYGAARQAGDKYASTFNPAAGNVDFSARTERARKDYGESVRQAETAAEATRRRWQDLESQREGEYKQTFLPLSERLRNAQQIESDAERFKREQLQEGQRAGREDKRENLQLQRLQAQDYDKQIQDAQKKLNSQMTLAATMANSKELKGADARKLEATYGKLAGEAGVDLAELQATNKPGKLWGTNPDPAARKQLLDSKIEETRNLLDSLKKNKASLLQTKSSSGQEPQSPVESPKAPSKDPQIQQYADQNKLDYEQAKKVLVGRGYQPKE